MSEINTISEFILQAGCQYRVYDLGRGIRKLSTQVFLDVENGAIPHPYPRLGHAWVALVFWNRQQSEQQFIWFLKLPLDEQGHLVTAARNHFLAMVMEALGADLTNSEADKLPDNPYTFTPSQHQMANFNSQVRAHLKMPPSQDYQQVLDYLGAPQDNDWQGLSLQGLTDACARLSDSHDRLMAQFDHLSSDVQYILLHSLENTPIDVGLTERILEWSRQHSAEPTAQVATLRALAQSKATGLVTEKVDTLLASSLSTHSDILVVISGRHWQSLDTQARLHHYLEQLAAAGTDLFLGVFSDLVRLPERREQVLKELRNPERSDTLSHAIGQLFGAMQQ